MMRNVKLLLLFILIPLQNLNAQYLKFENHEKNCAISQRAFDNPISYESGWTMERYKWHIFYGALSLGLSEGLHKVTKIPRRYTAIASFVGIGFIPHILGGVVLRKYPIDYRDWIFDANNRALPVYLLQDNKWKAVGEYGVSYLLSYCYASP